ncbi:MAG: helix-turn-helix domain-containing protein [Deltaproteobacteria bacterium]|jgi:DNA-binding XRE family transcriptional regulator|nr:helix-turn-helix domain-containing protein [Deltaproteobacteria bacterium]
MSERVPKPPLEAFKIFCAGDISPALKAYLRSRGCLVAKTRARGGEAVKISPAEVLAGLRRREGLTQAELARNSGVPVKRVGEMEKGERGIDEETAIKLARALHTCHSLFW